MPNPSRAVIYARVSTRQQAEDGSSLDSQQAACRKLAISRGFTITEVFKEDYPGTELQRPLLDQLRQGIKTQAFDAFFCYSTDRLSRSPVHLALIAEECQRNDIELVFVTEPLDNSPEGQLLTFVRGWASQLEREKIKDRTIRGKASRIAEGKLPQGTGRTGTAFGYSYNRSTGRREVRAEEALVINRIFGLCDSGISPHRIAVILNDEGLRSPMGFLWDPRTVRAMLRNEIYAGRTYAHRTRRVYLGARKHTLVARPREDWIEINNATPAIVAEELFTSVQERLRSPFRVAGRVGVKYLLQGFLRCECGGAMCGTKMTGGHASGPFFYYYCLGTVSRPARPKTCTSRHVRMEELETKVWDIVRGILEDPETVIAEVQRRQGSPGAVEEQIAKLEGLLKNLEPQKQRVIKLYRFGEIDDEYVDREMRQLNRLSTDTQYTIDQLKTRLALSQDFEPLADRVRRFCQKISSQLDGFGFDDKREALSALQVRVTVNLDRTASFFCVVPAEEERYVNARHASGYMSPESVAPGIPSRAEFVLT